MGHLCCKDFGEDYGAVEKPFRNYLFIIIYLFK